MAMTKQIAAHDWKAFFDDFSRQQLTEEQPKAATVEVLSPSLGDQIEVLVTRLLGLGYDPRSEAFSVFLDDVADHLIFHPSEVWIVQDQDGFISTVQLACSDGHKEIIHLWRTGPLAPLLPDPLAELLRTTVGR
jgi:hypothetical protein